MNFENVKIEDLMKSAYAEYSKSIIQERALPDARDGLKPVQRRILYAMYEDGNTHDKPYKKSISGVANTMKSYHPHGDSSIYEAMIHMGQWWKTNLMMIDVQGNEGSIDGDNPAASRYVEARLSENAKLFTDDIPYKVVDMVPNFDDTKMEPTVLPARVPLCLLLGSTGIAAGYATEIPTFNLNEVVDATIYRLKNKKIDITQFIKGPDFPTGGCISGDIKKSMETGRGKITNSCNYHIEKGKKYTQMIINEIPYNTVKQDLVKNIVSLNKDFILECRDESDKDGIRIVIDIDKGVDINSAVAYILKNSGMSRNYNFNMVAIVDKTPKQVGVLDLIDAWIDFRKDVIKRKYTYLLEQYKTRKEVVEGLIKAYSVLDEVIKCIKNSKDRTDVIKNLSKEFGFTTVQATAIADMRLYRLSNTDIVALEKENSELAKLIKQAEKVVGSPKEVINVIVKELEEINKTYKTPRKTKLKEVQLDNIDESKLVQNEDVFVVITKDGYLKRIPEKKRDVEQFLKADDEIVYQGVVNSHNKINLFTDKGGYLTLTVHRIPECKPSELGTHLTQFVKAEGHKVIATGDGKMLTWTDLGMIKKFSTDEFVEPTKLINIPIYMKTSGTVMAVVPMDKEFIVTQTKTNVNFYPVSEITDTTLSSSGLAACKLKEGEPVIINHVNKTDKIKIGRKSMIAGDLTPTHRGYTGQKIK